MQDKVNKIEQEVKHNLTEKIRESWSVIPPFWPLKNLIAVNPLMGFDHLHFTDALRMGCAYFQQTDQPVIMADVNRESLKWLQVFFDEGQSTLVIPGWKNGFLACILDLMAFDSGLPNRQILSDLPKDPFLVIDYCLSELAVGEVDQEQFMTLMLTTLSGWSSYVLYKTDWSSGSDDVRVTKAEFTAFRLLLFVLFKGDSDDLLSWYRVSLENADISLTYEKIQQYEQQYQDRLFKRLPQISHQKKSSDAQFVFCIDVRSEPFRRHLESTGDYETFGFAGFFGVPVSVCHEGLQETYSSCPVLIQPRYQIKDKSTVKTHAEHIKTVYQSTKYTFTTSFPLVEAVGFWSGLLMGINTFFPKIAVKIGKMMTSRKKPVYHLDMPLDDQVCYAQSALKGMGLVRDFAELIFICGHKGESQNNALATSLDCGACGGRPGGVNAYALAYILNNPGVRLRLSDLDIKIPKTTYFIATEHNTTTDAMDFVTESIPERYQDLLGQVQQDLKKVQVLTYQERLEKLGEQSGLHPLNRAQDWSQPRPEWALANNGSFIIAPRQVTQFVDLEGRSFLHSYDWTIDPDGSILRSIMTAPMVVGYWINSQYLLSTLDPVAYGVGSKVTKNIAGKIAITQGNASDLMHGLSLQSIGLGYDNPYHEPVRLTVVVYAPQSMVESVINSDDLLTKLVRNQWIHIFSMNPKTHVVQRIVLGETTHV